MNDSILVMTEKLVTAVSRGRGRILLVYLLRCCLVALAMVVCGCYGCVVVCNKRVLDYIILHRIAIERDISKDNG